MADKKIKFKAVLFDLDGTLLDTLRDIADSVNSGLKQLGFATHPAEACKYFVGDGIETLVERSLPESGRDAETVAKCLELTQSEYNRRWAVHSKPYRGIRQMLGELQKQAVSMAVLSNKPHEFTCRMVNEFLGDYRFEVVRGAMPGIPIKPAPDAALQIAGQMKIPPARFVCVGDGDTDMQTADAAGMYAVGALWGYRTADELTRAGARILIKKPGEVVALFDTL
jgi:phosphoglycolate phosphatase